MFKTKIKNRTSRFCSTSCVSRDATARSRCSVISATSSAREHVAGTSRTIRAFAIHSRYAALSSPAATRLGASGLRARPPRSRDDIDASAACSFSTVDAAVAVASASVAAAAAAATTQSSEGHMSGRPAAMASLSARAAVYFIVNNNIRIKIGLK